MCFLVYLEFSLRTPNDDSSVGDHDKAATNLSVFCKPCIYNFRGKTIRMLETAGAVEVRTSQLAFARRREKLYCPDVTCSLEIDLTLAKMRIHKKRFKMP